MEVIAKDEQGNERVVSFDRINKNLYDGLGATWSEVCKEDDRQESRQQMTRGCIAWPFNITTLPKFQILNQYHSTCLHAKKNTTVGLGFVSEAELESGVSAINSSPADKMAEDASLSDDEREFGKYALNPFYFESEVDTILNPLCRVSWSDVLTAAGEEYYQAGNGFIEVVRQRTKRTTTTGGGISSVTEAGEIRGLYHCLAQDINPCLTEDKFLHWRIKDSLIGGEQYWPSFGEWDEFKNNKSLSAKMKGSDKNYSEIIHLRKPSAMHSILGYPDWFSAIHPMELISAMTQYKYNFFNNRGVPEFMLFIKGQVSTEQWTLIENAIKSNIGKFNSHKTFAVNFDDIDVQVQVEKLGLDSGSDTGMFKDKESLQADIVTAHRMPPLLGNILIPGKLGSTNEFPNALMSFQAITVSQEQRNIEQTLQRTLGNEELNSGLGVRKRNLILRKITDLINIGQADTVSRMRETTEEAAANGRDISEGLED